MTVTEVHRLVSTKLFNFLQWSISTPMDSYMENQINILWLTFSENATRPLDGRQDAAVTGIIN